MNLLRGIFYTFALTLFTVNANAYIKISDYGANIPKNSVTSYQKRYKYSPAYKKPKYAYKKKVNPSKKKSWYKGKGKPRLPSRAVAQMGGSSLINWKGFRMPGSVARKLADVESRFGINVRVGSSCRRGAVVAKSGKPSMHRYCRAVDFNVPRGKYQQVASYLKRTWSGGVGTYSGRHNHIHIDNHGGRWHN